MASALYLIGGVLFAAAIFFSIFLCGRFAEAEKTERFAAACLPPAFLLILFLFGARMIELHFVRPTFERLLRAFILLDGHALYNGPNNGPIFNTIYGPVATLTFIPAAFFRTPAISIFVAGIINAGLFFLPPLIFHLQIGWRTAREKIWALTGFVFFTALVFLHAGLDNSAFNIHADGAALGYGGLACALIMGRSAASRASFARLFPAALFVALAVWTKQNSISLVLALPVYLILADGWKVAVRFVFCMALCGLALAAIFVSWFGLDNLVFNMVVVPSRHPWVQGKHFSLPLVGLMLLGKGAAALGIVAAGCCWLIRNQQSGGETRFACFRSWLRENPWTILLFAALFLVPMSILGKIKRGGADHSFHTLYYLVAAASLIAAKAARINYRKVGLLFPIVCLVLLIFSCVKKYKPYTHELPQLLSGQTPSEVAIRFARTHPGEIYFPYNGLAHYLAEGKVYHTEFGLIDRIWAGLPPSHSQLMAHLPQRMRWIAFYDRQGPSEYLPREFKRPVSLPGLPGWTVFERDEEVSPLPVPSIDDKN